MSKVPSRREAAVTAHRASPWYWNSNVKETGPPAARDIGLKSNMREDTDG